jgi:HD-like signal output (HDOD) protein
MHGTAVRRTEFILSTQILRPPVTQVGNFEAVRGLFASQVARAELELPMLPEVAARVLGVATSGDADAAAVARLITADPALAAHVMRVASSAIYQPRSPIESLQHAISWLGLSEVADIAFTVAVQGKLLNVPGQKARVLRMWKHSVATAVWSRLVAEATGRPADAAYLNGLLHEIGKPVCVQTIAELARRAATPLVEAEFDSLVAEFHVQVGVQLANAWKLPGGVAGVIEGWQDWANVGERRDCCAIAYFAHHLATGMLENYGSLAADALAADPVTEYLGLGLADVLALCAQSDHVQALVDHY